MSAGAPALDRAKVEKFMGQAVSDVGSAMLGALSFVGDQLGIFRALAETGPVTIPTLAEKTRLSPRYLQEWLNAMTAAEYLEYRSETGEYLLPPEHAFILAQEESPFFIGGFLEMIVPLVSQTPKLMRAFKTGKGIPQSSYPPETFEAIERSTAPWYRHKLTQEWILTMPDVHAKLEAGGSALDVGCGSGRASIAIAKAYPAAHATGIDNHEGSIARAKANAKAEGVAKRVTFKAMDARRLRGQYDFVTTFDVVHDAADPLSLLRAIRKALAPGGTYMMLEMNAAPSVEGNVNPIGKFMYAMSTLYCLTQSLAAKGEGIGTVMGEPKARELATRAGFGHFRRLPIRNAFAMLFELKVEP